MTTYGQPISNPNAYLQDSASTYILPKYYILYNFSSEVCKIVTMVGNQNVKFQKGRTTIALLKRFFFMCKITLYASNAPRSQIIYRDLRTSKNLDLHYARIQ